MEFAPVAQRLVRRLLFESVRALERVSSHQQGFEFLIDAALAEHVFHVIEVVGQEFAGKVQRQGLAETEVSLVGNRDVVLVILDVVWQPIVELVQIGKFGTSAVARPPTRGPTAPAYLFRSFLKV